MARPRPAFTLTLVCTACRTFIGCFVPATFGPVEIGGSFFWWSVKTSVSCRCGGFRDADHCAAAFGRSLQAVTFMHIHRHGCLGLADALLCCVCLLTVRANNALVRRAGRVQSFSVLLPCSRKGVGVF